jgi:hypothetical protein
MEWKKPKEQNPIDVYIDVSSREEASKIVSTFWKGVLPEDEYKRQMESGEGFMGQINWGFNQRTNIFSESSGKFRVMISGNGEPIPDKAWGKVQEIKNSGYNIKT